MAYTPEQRLAIVTAICDNYAELTEDGRGATWEKCILAQIDNKDSFYRWVKKYDECDALYKEAQDKRAKTERAIIERKSRCRLLRRIEDGTTIRRTERLYDKDGNLVNTKKIVEKRECSDPAIMFALKNLDPAFAENKATQLANSEDGRVKININFVNPTPDDDGNRS